MSRDGARREVVRRREEKAEVKGSVEAHDGEAIALAWPLFGRLARFLIHTSEAIFLGLGLGFGPLLVPSRRSCERVLRRPLLYAAPALRALRRPAWMRARAPPGVRACAGLRPAHAPPVRPAPAPPAPPVRPASYISDLAAAVLVHVF
jgi:hypothetical protein